MNCEVTFNLLLDTDEPFFLDADTDEEDDEETRLIDFFVAGVDVDEEVAEEEEE